MQDMSIKYKLHHLQNVILISSRSEVATEEIENIVKTIAANKDDYKIQDKTLPFDVLVRINNSLLHYAFNAEGNKEPSEAKDDEVMLHENGLFYYQLKNTDDQIESFQIGDARYTIEKLQHSDSQISALIKTDEIAAFIKDNFLAHMKDWGLENEKIDSEKMQEHISHLVNASDAFYLVRDDNSNLAAISGLTSTQTEDLAYITIPITRIDIRGMGIFSAILQRITNDYPKAVFCAYVVNEMIRKHLGIDAIVHQNTSNTISQEKNTQIQKRIEGAGITFNPPEIHRFRCGF